MFFKSLILSGLVATASILHGEAKVFLSRLRPKEPVTVSEPRSVDDSAEWQSEVEDVASGSAAIRITG